MNWIHFLSWVAGIYALYYLALILTEFLRGRNNKVASAGELTFSEDITPKKVEHLPDKIEKAPEPVKPVPATMASGGVSLKNLFGLCREEAIIYTRPVSF